MHTSGGGVNVSIELLLRHEGTNVGDIGLVFALFSDLKLVRK